MATDDEVEAMAASGHFDAMARYVPACLQELQQAAESTEPDFSDPSVLARVTVPVLFLLGTQTQGSWAAESTRYVADHVADAQVRQIPGFAHFGALGAPEMVADGLVRFFDTALTRA